MPGPCLIINGCKIVGEFFELIFFNMLGREIGIAVVHGVPVVYLFFEARCWIKAETYLVEEKLKSIVFKKFYVIRWIVVHTIQWFIKAFIYEAPPFVSFPKIDWPVHRLHSLLDQPMFGIVKHKICSILAVDAFKEADAPDGDIISLVFI